MSKAPPEKRGGAAGGRGGSTSNAADQMLISASIADAPTQRFYVLSILVFLQALKFYDLLQLYTPGTSAASSETIFVVKWIAIDTAYFVLVPYLRIPWLSFRLSTVMLQVLVFSVLNVCLSARISISPMAILSALLKLFFDRETAVLEHNIKLSSIIHNASRILGQHTINILPESTAKLNPQGACFCTDIDSGGAPIAIPLRLNATVPMLISYSRISPEDNTIERFNLTGKELKTILKRTEHSRHTIWDLPLPISKPGLYMIDRVLDESTLDVRLYRSRALVVTCPSASLVIPKQLQDRSDRCTGDLDELTLRVTGLPPLKVKYNRYVEGAERISTIDSVKPIDYVSPLMVSRHDVGEEHPLGVLTKLDDVQWANERSVDVQLNSTLNTPGQWSYTIEEVEDACGNVVNFNSAKERDSEGAPNYSFRVHRRPAISFFGCDPENPLRLVEGQKTNLRFAINSPEQGPFDIAISKANPDALISTKAPMELFRQTKLTTRGQTIPVDTEGVYSIESFSSRYCPGEVRMPASCVVFTPPRPSLSVAFEPISDQCAGSIGLLADLTLTGTPPFEVAWRESKGGRAIVHRKRIDRSRQQLRFLPEEAGSFSYEFFSLDDAVYKGIDVSGQGLQQQVSVYPLAGAQFADRLPRRCCMGDAVKLPVRLVGTGPWTLEYELISSSGKREHFKQIGLRDFLYEIVTPPMTLGGQHTVSLVSIQDANGCKTPLEEKDATIDVRRDKPSAAFATINDEREVTVIEGTSVALPLRLLGDAPWRIEYEGPEGRLTTTVSDPNGHISVSKAGTYRLLGVKDAYCPGVLTPEMTSFAVSHFDKPILFIESDPTQVAPSTEPLHFTRNEVCEGDEDAFNINIRGAAPFAIKYERARVNDRGVAQDRKQVELNAALPVVGIKAVTSPAGLYRYTFDGIADARYDLTGGKAGEPLVVEQYVRSRPQASFVSPGKVHSYCLEVDLADQEADRIPMKLVGAAPFKLELSIKHELSGITEHFTETNVDTHDWALRVPSRLLSLGRHAIRVLEVTDAKGCTRLLSEKQGAIFIEISERPTILPSSSRRELCVGDKITYALQGKPPFVVEYTFEGSHKKATVNGPVFSRVAEKPGHFKLLTLADSASRCKVSITNQEKTIHDIPSVRVSDGKYFVESIHQGDQAEIVFHLVGQPPFSLTYTRSEKDARGRLKVMETHSVSGIQEHTYKVYSSVSGTYAATQVYDAHCRMV
ncbi:hypothetical protein PYCC9005_003901 [Savitreella phatthalungensis]